MYRIAFTYLELYTEWSDGKTKIINKDKSERKFNSIDVEIPYDQINIKVFDELTDYICDQLELDRLTQEVFIISIIKYSESYTLPTRGL